MMVSVVRRQVVVEMTVDQYEEWFRLREVDPAAGDAYFDQVFKEGAGSAVLGGSPTPRAESGQSEPPRKEG